MSEFLRHEQCPRCAAAGGDTARNNMGVYSDGGTYCFACGYSNGIGGVSRPKELNLSDAVQLPMYTSESILRKYGVEADVIKRYGVRCINSEEYGMQLEFPIHDVNKQEYNVCRRGVNVADGSLTREMTYGKGRLKLPLFGWSQVTKTTEYILVCEGLTDTLAAATALKTIANVAVVGMLGSQSANKTAAHFAAYGSKYKVILAFDNDKAGAEAQAAFGAYLDKHQIELPVSVLSFPKEYKDIRDWLAAESPNLLRALESADPLVNLGLLDSKQIALKLDEYFSGLQNQQYIKLSFSPTLSEACRLTAGMLLGVIGDGGQGKSTFVEHICMEAMQLKQRVLFVSQEMQAAEVAIKLLRMVRNEPLEDLVFVNSLSGESRAEIFDQCQRLLEYMHTTDSFGELSTEAIDKHIHKLTAIGQKPALVIVDHLLAISSDSENNTILNTCKELKAIAANHGICVALLSHVRKKMNTGKRDLYRPQASDAYGSIGLAAYSDVIVAVATDSQSQLTYVETVKKGRLVGKYADVTLTYQDYKYAEVIAHMTEGGEYTADEEEANVF